MPTMTMPTITMTREELIEALEARRKWAVNYDRVNVAEHKAAEKAFLEDFRDACRKAAKWDYEKAKANYFEIKFRKHNRPSCPASAVAKLDQILTALRLSKAKNLTISATGMYETTYWLLTHDETAALDVC